MTKYNLYRIKLNLKDDLIQKLESAGLVKVREKDVSGFKLSFYFSEQPDIVDIWWAEAYAEFLETIPTPKNQVYCGTLLAYSGEACFAVSLGKSHFYLKPYCDLDFGLNLAERIVDSRSLKIKNSKFYKSRKSKSITTYNEGSEVDYDSGESMHYLKAKTMDEAKWGKAASFGNSVQMNLSIRPTDLPELIAQIERELLNPPVFRLPRVDLVQEEEKIRELDRKLANAIWALADGSVVNIDEFTVSGVNFVFSDTHSYSLYLKGQGGNKFTCGELTVDNLVRFVRNSGIDLCASLDDIRVHVHSEYGRDFSQPLKFYLDFIDDEERHCLLDGKWYRFNQSYLEFLAEEVNRIELSYDATFDIMPGVNEERFNRERAEKDGFVNYDKELTSFDGKYRVEKMDLYRDGSIYFVKIGTPQKLSYVIDQAVTTVKILKNNQGAIEIDGDRVKVENICLWLILDRRNEISKLSDLNSIIFHMKLVEWRKVVTDASYRPRVFVNYLRNEWEPTKMRK